VFQRATLTFKSADDFERFAEKDWRDYRVIEAAIGRSELISKPWTNPPMQDVRVSSWSSGSQKL
jgi:hypothetical protein